MASEEEMSGAQAPEDADALQADGQEKGGKTRRRQICVVLIVCAVVVALIAGYAVGVNQLDDRFLPNTSINGLDVSGLTPQEAQAKLEEETASYLCTVGVGSYAGAFRGQDVGLDRDEARMVQDAFAQVNVYTWPLRVFSPLRLEVDPGITYNQEVLADVVRRSVDDFNATTLPTADAYIVLDKDTGLYELEGSTQGTAVDKEAVVQAMAADVSEFHTSCAPDPSVALHDATVDDLPAYAYAVVRANTVRTSDVPILVNGEQVDVATSEQTASWVSIDDTPAVAVDTDAIESWANNAVVYSVYHRDDWSNYYLDVDEFVSQLADRLSLGVVDGFEAPTYDELRTEGSSRELAYQRGGWNEELGRYIDVDLEAQFVRLFDETGNVIWESACVSGDLYESRSTVTGVFEIYSKQMGTTLVGLDYNNDGKPDYESYVNYWMPFYGGYGLHDATWRSSFGGDYFYYDGSHGCINLPYNKAEELYNITFVGEKVNVHW